MEGDGGPAPKHPQQLFFDNVSPATRLLEKRRKMYEVQDALENQKARFAKDEEQFKKREEHLRGRDLQLQHQLFRFNKFLQDNEAKSRRAETRAAEEAAQIRQKEAEITDLERQLEDSQQLLDELEGEVARNMKYEEFLERVKNSCEDYQEIQDLVTRYDTLESANKDLMEIATASENQIEEITNDYHLYRKQQEMEMLAFTTRIAALSQELDESVKARQQLESNVDEATQEDSKHSLYFGRILMSVENLYQRCTAKRTNIRHVDEFTKSREGEEQDGEGDDSFERKQQTAIRELKVILAYLRDFKDMTETLRKERRSWNEQKAKTTQAVDINMKPPEPKIVVENEAPRNDRGSQNSSSQGNTRDLGGGASKDFKNVSRETGGGGGD